MNKKDGTFEDPIHYDTGRSYQTWEIIMEDIEQDEDLDIIVSFSYESALIFLNNGDGSLSEDIKNIAGSGSVDKGDLNLDGYLDIVFSSGKILLNKGDGTFEEQLLGYSTNNDLAIGDFDLDGYPDLAATFSYDTVSIFKNHGNWDNDGIGVLEDNCPSDFNPDQTDSDEDGIGDSCEPSESSIPQTSSTRIPIFSPFPWQYQLPIASQLMMPFSISQILQMTSGNLSFGGVNFLGQLPQIFQFSSPFTLNRQAFQFPRFYMQSQFPIRTQYGNHINLFHLPITNSYSTSVSFGDIGNPIQIPQISNIIFTPLIF